MKITIVLIIVFLIVWYEVPKMVSQHMKKELIIFGSIQLIAFILAILYIQEINIPNPASGLRYILSPIGLAVENFFTK